MIGFQIINLFLIVQKKPMKDLYCRDLNFTIHEYFFWDKFTLRFFNSNNSEESWFSYWNMCPTPVHQLRRIQLTYLIYPI